MSEACRGKRPEGAAAGRASKGTTGYLSPPRAVVGASALRVSFAWATIASKERFGARGKTIL